ncbi:MAG: aminodeoxychorismate lyase [Alphaproteobacteria bacterium]|nr:aminodeoxychorismate lyase [Alphaproteobacteria bacterium]
MNQDPQTDIEPTTPDESGPPPRRRRAGWFVSILIFVLIAGATLVGGGMVMLHRAYTDPGPLAADTRVIIPRGASGRMIGGALAETGVVADPRLFALAVRVFAPEQPLRAGEYAFPARISLRDAVAKLQSGEMVLRRLTIAEGLTTREILAQISAVDGLSGDVPEPGDIAEGALLPETYHYSWGDDRGGLVQRMVEARDEALAQLWPARKAGLPIASPQDAVVLASIVERETGLSEERARVAAVFINRLNRGMRLQSDPTVAYGIAEPGGALDRPLTRADLKVDHPYNTYVHAGLPPGPIANPGLASIEAVLNPSETSDLYFVADGTGGHAFARTLAEHNRNVARWRRIQRELRRSK